MTGKAVPVRRPRRSNSLKDIGRLLSGAGTAHEDHNARFRERAKLLHELEATVRDAFFRLLMKDLLTPNERPPQVRFPCLRSSYIPSYAERLRTRINGRLYNKRRQRTPMPPHPVVRPNLPLTFPRGMTRAQALDYARQYWSRPWQFEPGKIDNHLRLNEMVQGYGTIAPGTPTSVDRYPDDMRRRPPSLDVDEIEIEIAELMCASPVIRAYLRGGLYGVDATLIGQTLKRVTETHKKLVDEIMIIRRADRLFRKKVARAEWCRWQRQQLASPRLAEPLWQVPNDEPLAWRSEILSTCTDIGMRVYKPRKRGDPKPFGEEAERDDMATRGLDCETYAARGDDGCPVYDDYSSESVA